MPARLSVRGRPAELVNRFSSNMTRKSLSLRSCTCSTYLPPPPPSPLTLPSLSFFISHTRPGGVQRFALHPPLRLRSAGSARGGLISFSATRSERGM